MRVNPSIGAPARSGPKAGNAWTNLSSTRAASAAIRDAVTTPCPPRPWNRISVMLSPTNFGSHSECIFSFIMHNVERMH